MVTVKLLGELGRRFGREYRLNIRTPAEALRCFMTQMPEFRQYILDSHDNGIVWRVVTENPMGLDEDGLHEPCSKRLVIAPQPAGRGAVGKILLGVALVVVGAVVAFGTAGGGIPFILAGSGLILGGVAQLLTPTPLLQQNQQQQQLNSFTFDRSNINTAQGSCVPVLYGERLVGALPVILFGIELQNSL